MNSLKKGEGVPLLNFEGSPGVPLLNFEGDLGVPLLNCRGVPCPVSQAPEVPGPGVLVSLLHHACRGNIHHPTLNFEGGPGVPPLNFRVGGGGVPGLNFKLSGRYRVPGPRVPWSRVLVPLLHYA